MTQQQTQPKGPPMAQVDAAQVMEQLKRIIAEQAYQIATLSAALENTQNPKGAKQNG